MIVVTTDTIEGKRIVEIYGLVRGNTVRAGQQGGTSWPGLRDIVGGEITEYSRLLTEARDQASARMTASADKLGANAVVGVRMVTSGIMGGVSEILVDGTAAKVE